MNAMVSEAANRALREEIDQLREENRQLKERLGIGAEALIAIETARSLLSVPPQAARLLVALVSAPMLRKEVLAEICSPTNWENIEDKVGMVMICRLRRALKPFGVGIENIWGTGYRVAEPDRTIILQMLGLSQVGGGVDDSAPGQGGARNV